MSKASRAATTVLLLAVIAVGGSCGGDDSKPATEGAAPAPRGDQPLAGRDLVARVQPATVSILALPPGETREPFEGGRHVHGTGIVYDARRGLVLTSSHFLEAAGSIRVLVNERSQVRARPVARAQCSGFALLELRPRPRGLTQLPFADSSAVRPGDRVSALGYLHPPGAPKASLIKTDGAVSSVDVTGEVHPKLPPFQSLILHQAPLQSHMSGGPLVNDRGELVGINIFIPGGAHTESGPWEAVPSNYIKKRISELRRGSARRYVGWEREHARCGATLKELSDETMKSHPKPSGPQPS
jgi:S1-C subfamily serine protease